MFARTLLLALLSFVFCSAAEAAPAKFKLGVIAPLTGPVAAWGVDARNVISFANERFGENRFELIFEDDNCVGKQAVTAATKLITIDHVDFAMVICTESMLTTAPLFEKSKTIVITPVATGAAVSQAGDYIYRTWPSDAAAADVLVRHLAGRYRRVGLLSEERGYAQELATSIAASAAKANLTLLSTGSLSETNDFRTLLIRLRTQSPEALILNTNTEEGLLAAVKQLRELHWSVPLYGAYLPGNESFLKLAGDAADGMIFVDAPSADSALTRDGQALYADFRQRFGEIHSSSFIFGATLEAFRRLVDLSATHEDWRRVLDAGHFDGVFGPYSFDSNGDIVGVQHVLKIIDNGKPVPLK